MPFLETCIIIVTIALSLCLNFFSILTLASTSQPHGRAWKIHNKDLLISEVVPRYFVQSKYQSFARQLNGWGFKRLHQAGNDFNAYYHECFLRGMPQLAVLMKRVSPNQGRLLSHLEREPNFYSDKYSTLPPLGTTRPDQYPCPPPTAIGAGYALSPAPPAGFYNAPPNDFSCNHRFTYPLPPPPSFYGHPAVASYASNMGYPSYHPYDPMPYGPLFEQYPHFYHTPGPLNGAGSFCYDDVPPGTPVHVKGDEARSSTIDPAPLPQVPPSAPQNAIEAQRQPLEHIEAREDSFNPFNWYECEDNSKETARDE